MKRIQHVHRPRRALTRELPFRAPVANPQNPRAHGNIMRREFCGCGKIRETNINQTHIERGSWHWTGCTV